MRKLIIGVGMALALAAGTAGVAAAEGGPAKHQAPNLGLVAKCPAGTVRVMFDVPVYDEDGLFVVGYDRRPFCVPVDLEPAG
jgi:hypothetical protein